MLSFHEPIKHHELRYRPIIVKHDPPNKSKHRPKKPRHEKNNGLLSFVLSSQATPDGPHHGGAIYSQGSVHLRGGVTFADNIVSGDDDGHEAGDGGAVWNGPTARMMVGSTAVLRSNAVGVGGRGGALWNEGFVEFQNKTIFALNQVS